jgi:hypothetical protein
MVIHDLAVQSDQDITDDDSACPGRAVFLDPNDQETRILVPAQRLTLLLVERGKLAADAEIASPDAAVLCTR